MQKLVDNAKKNDPERHYVCMRDSERSIRLWFVEGVSSVGGQIESAI